MHHENEPDPKNDDEDPGSGNGEEDSGSCVATLRPNPASSNSSQRSAAETGPDPRQKSAESNTCQTSPDSGLGPSRWSCGVKASRDIFLLLPVDGAGSCIDSTPFRGSGMSVV